MFGHRSFLVIGGDSPADILSLINGGYEISDCRFSFEQGLDDKGKATTRVYFGIINIKLPQLPSKDIIEWAINARKYNDGAIIVLDAENTPIEKVLFKNTACVNFKLYHTQHGDSYTITELVLQAEKIIVGNGIDFENEWTDY